MEKKSFGGYFHRKYTSFKAAANEFGLRALTSFTFTAGCALVSSGLGAGGFKGALVGGGFWLAKSALRAEKEQHPSLPIRFAANYIAG